MCKSQPTDDKLSLIASWSDHVTRYKILRDPIISLEQLNLKSSNLYTSRLYINSNNRLTYHQQKGRGYGYVTVLKFCRLSWCSASSGFVSDS